MKRGLTFAVVSMLLIISGRLCHASTDYVVLSLDISTDIVSRAGTVMEEYVTMANEYIQGKIGSVGDINAVKKQKDKVDRLKKRTEKLQKMQKKAKAIADKAKEKKAALQARADRMKEMADSVKEKYRAAQAKYQKVQDKINEAQTKINDVKDKVQSKVNAVQSEIDKAKGYVDQTKDYANQARTYVQEGIETVGELKDTAQNYANRVKQTATGYVDQASGYINDAQQVLGNSVPNSEVSMQEPAFEQTFPTDVVAAQEEYNTAVQYEMPVAQPEVADDLSEQMTAAGVSAQEGLELMVGANPEMASQTGEALVQKGTISIQQKADALLAIKDMAMSSEAAETKIALPAAATQAISSGISTDKVMQNLQTPITGQKPRANAMEIKSNLSLQKQLTAAPVQTSVKTPSVSAISKLQMPVNTGKQVLRKSFAGTKEIADE